MAIKIKTDENLPDSAAGLLRNAGHDVVTALEEGLGGAPDPELAAACRREGRALVTLDRGFGDIRAFPPTEYPGLVVLRARDQGIQSILELTRRLITLLETRTLIGALWILDEHRLRIRH